MFLNPVRVILHVSTLALRLESIRSLLDLCMPASMQLSVSVSAGQKDVPGLQSLVLQEEKDTHLRCRRGSSEVGLGPGQAVTLWVFILGTGLFHPQTCLSLP